MGSQLVGAVHSLRNKKEVKKPVSALIVPFSIFIIVSFSFLFFSQSCLLYTSLRFQLHTEKLSNPSRKSFGSALNLETSICILRLIPSCPYDLLFSIPQFFFSAS